MQNKDKKQKLEEYRDQELVRVLPILEELGLTLESKQPHISGERYLMQAITTTHGKKLILLAKHTSDSKKVVIKATSDPAGKRELLHERESRRVLQEINFAYNIFFSPEEILFVRKNQYVISVHTFIEQKCSFLERPLEEQFFLALKSFKAQEGAHAATYEHRQLIKKTFGSWSAKEYLKSFKIFRKNIIKYLPENTQVRVLLEKGAILLKKEVEIIEQYCGFLTHVDFVPHNFRVVMNDIYLLDHSSIRFGNKYEGWARFLNFMILYNRPLEQALLKYVTDNRAEEELLSLRLMRIYRLGEIIWYYTNTLQKSSGELLLLNKKRVEFWAQVLKSLLNNTTINERVIEDYKHTRDSLRSDEEKQRQIELH